MRLEVKHSLEDIVSHGEELLKLMGEDGSAYKESRVTALAIERLIGIIAAKLSTIKRYDIELADQFSQLDRVLELRSTISESYRDVDPDKVVDCVLEDVPGLVQLADEALRLNRMLQDDCAHTQVSEDL